MATPNIVLTLTGQTLIADALAEGGTVEITKIAFGDGGGAAVVIDRNRVSLVNEVYNTTIDAVVTDPGDPTLKGLQYIIPANEGGYVIREVGLFDALDNLVAHGPIPAVEKPADVSGFALALAGTIWIKVTDADSVEVSVSVSANVPQARTLTAGLGIAGGGDLSADRSVSLDLSELLVATTIPADLTFTTHSASGEFPEDKHKQTPLAVLDKRWRQRDVDLLWYGQF